MTLSVNTSFLSNLGLYSLQGNALQPQSNSPAQSPPDEVEHISSPSISLSENTK
ncbi:phospholipase [Xenorhabdus eapokensis]|uniref:Phospholipase n=1 Tax=Xenorhabdus eapokensis TaxID=1873482 RepID=A0A1Q5THK1_9GAMM|nr:phospholipase [Xenorhabdus eapokensis]